MKPILNHISTELEEADGDTDMAKEIKERIKVDLELRYLDDDISQLLELTSFLDPRFKLTQVSDRAGILKEIELQMLKEMDINVPTCHSSAATTSTRYTHFKGMLCGALVFTIDHLKNFV